MTTLDIDPPWDVSSAAVRFAVAVNDGTGTAADTAGKLHPPAVGSPSALDTVLTGKASWMADTAITPAANRWGTQANNTATTATIDAYVLNAAIQAGAAR